MVIFAVEAVKKFAMLPGYRGKRADFLLARPLHSHGQPDATLGAETG